MSENRTVGRNVHIYDARDPNTAVGGFILTNGVTNANFYSMVEILCIFNSNYSLQDEGGTTIQRDDQPLRHGKYYIVADGMYISCVIPFRPPLIPGTQIPLP